MCAALIAAFGTNAGIGSTQAQLTNKQQPQMHYVADGCCFIIATPIRNAPEC